MGICASCLGLNRHPSQDGDLDRILDSADQPSYGAVDDNGISQMDEEELRREREALEHITAHAADHMIDVLHPSHLDASRDLASSNHHVIKHESNEAAEAQEDADEAAWLESIQSAGLDTVRVPQRGVLATGIGTLREATQQTRPAMLDAAY